MNGADPHGLQPSTNNRSTYGGFEGHFIYGGGIEVLNCCEGNRQMLKVYVKVCIGAAFGYSYTVGGVFNVKDGTCPDLSGPSIEGGYGPLEVGVSISPDMPVTIGYGGGWGGKFTPCWYFLVSEKDLGCCRK